MDTDKNQKSVDQFRILMNWVRDGNLKSPYPKALDNCTIGMAYFLWYFLPSSKYFVLINDLFNNWDALTIKPREVMMMFKEIVHHTGYNCFQRKKAEVKENELIKILWKKYPYFKKDDICLLVDIIDNSEEKDIIYEMFDLVNKVKVKKLNKIDINKRKKKIESIVKSEDVLDML